MAEAPIGHLAARAYRIPTDAPEADGTLAWNATTVVVVEIAAGGVQRGLAIPLPTPPVHRLPCMSLPTRSVASMPLPFLGLGRPWSPPCATLGGEG